MPDWSYHTLFRPLLFRLPARTARSITLGAMGAISRLPGGTLLIKTLGHMEADRLLESEAWGISVKTPVGLSGETDPHGQAQRALAQFGFGFQEVGPVTVKPIHTGRPIRLEKSTGAILYPSHAENDGLVQVEARLVRRTGHSLPILVRLRAQPGSTDKEAVEQYGAMMARLGQHAAAFCVDLLYEGRNPGQLESLLRGLKEEADRQGKPLLLNVPVSCPDGLLEQWLERGILAEWAGYIVRDGIREGEEAYTSGVQAGPSCAAKVEVLRRRAGAGPAIIAAGGIHEPADGLKMLHAGASLVMLGSGLVFSGPGLPKRVNEAILHERVKQEPVPVQPSFWRSWGWMCLLGLGMIIGGVLAWIVAATTVLLPYDEGFLGLSGEELSRINPHLLHFMSHDRITLAGTMITIGILYAGFGFGGLRRGMHWAKTALLVSGVIGFGSFFLYIGYGYFDPLHGAAALILLPLFLLAMLGHRDLPSREPVNLRNDRVWRLSQWGQLFLVALGAALAAGGIVIAGVGVSTVFVPQDLDFLGAAREELEQANERLVPLIAHDRAGFGGALLSSAAAILCAALWGVQQGRRWLWIVLAIGGLPGFAAGLGVHLHIGYTDFIHLLPVYAALGLYLLGLALLYPYMMGKPAGGKPRALQP